MKKKEYDVKHSREGHPDVPFRRYFCPAGRFAYVTPLTFGRARICVTTEKDPLAVHDFY